MSFNFKRGCKRIGRYISKHQPAILAGIACAGVVVTAVTAAKCHSKAEEILWQAEKDIDNVDERVENDEITEEQACDEVHDIRVDCAKALGMAYAPAVLSGALTITTIILSHKAHLRTEAVLTTALNGATALLGDYKDEVKKILKPKQQEELKQNMAKKEANKRPVPTETATKNTRPSEDVIFDTGLGNQLMKIDKIGPFVRCSEENLNKILFNKIQNTAINEGYSLINDLEWELFHNQSGDGAVWGWEDEQFKNGEILRADVTYTNYIDQRTGSPESIGIAKFNIPPRMINIKPSARYH